MIAGFQKSMSVRQSGGEDAARAPEIQLEDPVPADDRELPYFALILDADLGFLHAIADPELRDALAEAVEGDEGELHLDLDLRHHLEPVAVVPGEAHPVPADLAALAEDPEVERGGLGERGGRDRREDRERGPGREQAERPAAAAARGPMRFRAHAPALHAGFRFRPSAG